MRNHQNSSAWTIPRFSFDVFLVVLSVAVILCATLYPFNFYFYGNLSIQKLITSFDNTSFLIDQVNNILLFMPLGFGMTSILKRRSFLKISVKLAVITIVSICLSASVEILQLFLPSRTPTPADIMNNTLGGILGLVCFYIWDSNSFSSALMRLENSHISRSFKRVNFLIFTYIILAYLITVPWQYTSRLSTWNSNFPLLIGNEATGDRPWQGYISNLAITDQAVSQQQIVQLLAKPQELAHLGNTLIAAYQLDQKTIYQDTTGQLPDLVWRGNLRENQEIQQLGTSVNRNHWLESTVPVTKLNQRISDTSEFTIITTIGTVDFNQTGPARIISLSGDASHRNFTLGQDKTDLVLRLRTPLTGQNGADIQLHVPGIFIDTKPHNVIVTYSQGTATVYVNDVRNYLAFNLLELIPQEQKLFSYGMTFIPLGFCLAFMTILFKRRYLVNRFVLPVGVLLPALILEAILIHQTAKDMSLINIFLGMFFTASATFVLRLRTVILDN